MSQYKYNVYFIFPISTVLIIMSSITLSITGNSSQLRANFHPEIELDERYNYSCCLLDFYTYNSIPNVHEGNNKFYYEKSVPSESENVTDDYSKLFEKIVIPVGSYEIAEILDYIQANLRKEGINFVATTNKNTMKCKIECDVNIDFERNDCIGSVLGFSKRILNKNEIQKSDHIVNIQHISSIRLDCDLTSGSFHNGQSTHTIYEFSPSVDPGYKINEQPKHLIYLPLVKRRINEVNISVVDQKGNLVDFRGEEIACRIHIRRDF